MNCKQTQKQISLLIDGSLDYKKEQFLLEHIDSCDECKALYEKTKAIVDGFKNMPEVQLPEGVENKIHFALLREAANHPKKRRWVRFVSIAAPVAAAAFVAVLGISYAINGGFTPTNDSQEMAIMVSEEMEEAEMAPKTAPNDVLAESAQFGDGISEHALDESSARMMESEEESDGEAQVGAFYVDVSYSGNSEIEMEEYVRGIISLIDAENSIETFYEQDTKQVKVFLPVKDYEQFMEVIKGEEHPQLLDTSYDAQIQYGENQLFEINFFFQNNID